MTRYFIIDRRSGKIVFEAPSKAAGMLFCKQNPECWLDKL